MIIEFPSHLFLPSCGQEVLGRRLGSLQEKTQQELSRVQEGIKENMAEERKACQVRGILE